MGVFETMYSVQSGLYGNVWVFSVLWLSVG